MSLNIKNPEAHALAATRSEASVRQRAERMARMAREVAERLTPDQQTMDVNAEVYDQHGLPK